MSNFSYMNFSKILSSMAAKSNRSDSKYWLPFIVHASDTAGIIKKLFNKWLPEHIITELSNGINENDYKRTLDLCILIALLHDTGKLTPAFQSKIYRSIENYAETMQKFGLNVTNIGEALRSPHSIAGQAILMERKFPDEIAIIIGSHHGRGFFCNAWEQIEVFPRNYFGETDTEKKIWTALWDEWISYSLNETGFTIETLPKPDVKSQMLLTALLIMADWIASNTVYFPYIELEETLDASACEERVNKAWKKLNLPSLLSIHDCVNSPEKFKERFEFYPNSVQNEVINIVSKNNCPGLYIIEAPMGLGKTEAALSSAEILIERCGAGGIYFGLPTQATANGIFKRIRDWASKCDPDKHSIRLAHGMTELNKEYKALFDGKGQNIALDEDDTKDKNIIVHEWFEGRKQALLSDFVIATIDQFLLASLKQKHVMLRHLGLAGKVVILDECHAYDAYMNVYLDKTLAWMGAYEVPVIVLSATLPPKRRAEMIQAYLNKAKAIEIKTDVNPLSYPILTYAHKIDNKNYDVLLQPLKSDISEKRISVKNLDEEDLISYLTEKLNNGGCAAIIVNTVAYAQELYKFLSSKLTDFNIVCFHSRFIATDRAKIEENLLRRVGKNSKPDERNKLIVIGTQVIEQSLDLDFDTMITELCPMDLLLQRSGRLHRHNRTRPTNCQEPVLAILKPLKPHRSIYDEWILEQTKKYLPNELDIPSCIPELVSKVYADSDEQTKPYKEYLSKIKEKKRNARKYCIPSNMLSDDSENLLTEFLKGEVENSKEAEASVRDTDETIEVIVLKKNSDAQYSLVSGEAYFNTTMELSNDEAFLIACERIRLQQFFTYHWDILMKELDVMPKRWRDSKLLKGELLLLLNENLEAELDGKKLRYSNETGLELISEGVR